MPSRVICGFAGIGKSHIADGRLFFDVDSSQFKNEFPKDYLTHIAHLLANTSSCIRILISTHVEVRDGLAEMGIPYTIVIPHYQDKFNYLHRYRRRDPDNLKFVHFMESNWEEFWTSCYNDSDAAHVHLLPMDGYLSDVIGRV